MNGISEMCFFVLLFTFLYAKIQKNNILVSYTLVKSIIGKCVIRILY